MNRKRIVLALTFCMALAIGGKAMAAGAVAQINLILDDGTILIYKGADYGFHKGDYLDVVRGGIAIGKLQITDVMPSFTRANIISQDKTIEVFDIVNFASPGSVTAPAGKDDVKDKEDEEKKKQEEKEAKEKEKEKKKKEKEEKDKLKKEEEAKKKKEKEEKKEEPAAQPKKEEPKTYSSTAMPKKYYNIGFGYFYINQNLDMGDAAASGSIDQPPSIMYGLDFWNSMGNKKKMLYSVMMSSPTLKIPTSGSPVSLKTKFMQVSANYIIDSVGEQKGSTGSFYYGVGAAWRSYKLDTEGYLAIVAPEVETTSTGIDFQGILGYRFTKGMEFKGLYSFDENYYYISLFYGMR